MTRHKIPDSEFTTAVQSSTNIFQAMTLMGLKSAGSGYRNFMKRCQNLGISTSHFMTEKEKRLSISSDIIVKSVFESKNLKECLNILGLSLNNTNISWAEAKIEKIQADNSHWEDLLFSKKTKTRNTKQVPIENILVNGKAITFRQKQKLIKEKILQNTCSNCGLDSWLNKPISLQLEHINGNHLDNRIENITLLCPNCHSQTPTFSRAKSAFIEKKTNYCIDCDKEIHASSIRCMDHAAQSRKKTKISWPPIDELMELLQKNSYLGLSKILGVSDNAIRKHIAAYKNKKPR